MACEREECKFEFVDERDRRFKADWIVAIVDGRDVSCNYVKFVIDTPFIGSSWIVGTVDESVSRSLIFSL